MVYLVVGAVVLAILRAAWLGTVSEPPNKRICIGCGWIGAEDDCFDYKHPIGARLCPECYEITEKM